MFQSPPGLPQGTVREAASRDGSHQYVSSAWTLPFEFLAKRTVPGSGKCLLTPKKGVGGGAPSPIVAEVGRDERGDGPAASSRREQLDLAEPLEELRAARAVVGGHRRRAQQIR